ncbi:MAG: DUF898 family protein [Myxococcota bacterium]
MSEAYYVLEITPADGPAETREVRQATVTVGRREGDIVIPDPGASGRHAEIRFDGSAVTVYDVGSTNGTLFQGGITREPFSLPQGEAFQIGRTRFRLAEVHAPAPEPAAPEPEPAAPAEEEDKTVVSRPAFDFGEGQEPAEAPVEQPAPQPPPAEAEPEKTAFLSADEPGPTQRAPSPQAAAPPPEAEPEPEKTAFLSTDAAASSKPEPAPEEPSETPPTERMEEAEATAWLEVPKEEPEPEPAPQQPPSGGDGAEKTAFLAAEGGQGGGEWAIEDEGWGEPVDGEAPTEEQQPPSDAPDWAAAYIEGGEGPPQQPAGGAPGVGGEGVRPRFSGTGGEIFKALIVGFLLTAITLGIYAPWFYVSLTRYMAQRTTVGPTARGQVRLNFTGSGGQLFVKGFIGYLLTMLTLGIYGFWFAVDLGRFFVEHTEGQAPDGSKYQARFTLSGGEFFKAAIVGALLTMITLGIYMPWFICKVHALFKGHTHLFENGEHLGSFEFHGDGGDLFVRFIVGYLLTLVTLGIYGAWFQVSLKQFFTSFTTLRVGDRVLQGGFTGTGGELFLIHFVGMLLLPLTLGIYFFWYVARLVRFNVNHLVFQEIRMD